MTIDWGALGLVSVVSLAVGVVTVVLFALGIVGLAARRETVGGAHDGRGPTLGPAAGTAVAVICFAGCAAILLYGLYIIAF